MSRENHPNINAAGLTVDILKAVGERLRGPAEKAVKERQESYISPIADLVAKFADEVSTRLDSCFGFPESDYSEEEHGGP